MRYPFHGTFPLTQPFGVNRAVYDDFDMIGHNGIDWGLPSGTPVLAAHDGVVRNLSDPPGFGNYVEIKGHVKTVYAHLSSFNVPNGATVTEGTQIGRSGTSGFSSGPHLHFGLKPIPQDDNNGYFGAVDPMKYLVKEELVSAKSPLDETAIRLAYNGWEDRDPSAAEIKAWLGRTSEDLWRSLQAGETHQQILAGYRNHVAGEPAELNVNINGTRYVPEGQ